MNRALIELEWSRYRNGLPGLKGERLSRLALYGVILTAVFCGLLSLRAEISVVYTLTLAVLFFFVVLMALFFILENMRLVDPSRQWWLQLPCDRNTLTMAKFRGYCGLGYVALATIVPFALLGCAIVAAARGSAGEPPGLSGLLAIAGIGITGVPVAAAWGMLGSAFFRRRWYWLVLYMLYLILSFGITPSALGVLIVMELGEIGPWMKVEWLTGVQLGMIVIGWPLAYGMLKLTARFGLANLADPRNMPDAAGKAASQAERRPARSRQAAAGSGKPPAGPFRALCELERRRLGVFADRLASRIIWLVIAAGLAVGGYFAYGSSDTILMVPAIASGLISYLYILYLPVTVGQDIAGRKLDWWLALPLPRWKLLAAKTYVHFRVAAVFSVSLYGAFWLGLLGRVAWDDAATWQGVAMDASWLAYVLLLGGLLFIAGMSYFIGAAIVNHAFPATSLPSGLLIFVPLLLRDRIASYYVADLDRLAEVAPYWDRLLWTALLALIFSALCLAAGVRYLNSLAKTNPKRANRLFGSQSRASR